MKIIAAALAVMISGAAMAGPSHEQQESAAKAVQMYPDLERRDSPMRIEADRLVRLYSETDKALMDRPDAPLIIAGRAAYATNVKPLFVPQIYPQQPAPTSPATPPVVTAPAQAKRNVSQGEIAQESTKYAVDPTETLEDRFTRVLRDIYKREGSWTDSDEREYRADRQERLERQQAASERRLNRSLEWFLYRNSR